MIRDEIVNIISNNCSRPGFDEYTRSADDILALFRKLVEGNKLVVCGNMDYQNGFNRALDDLLLELR